MTALGCHAGVALTVAADDVTRFWSLVEKGPECWIWRGKKASRQYGTFNVREADGRIRGRLAHRVCWTIVHGGIPRGMLVMHTCDNPPCVNPDHLWIGWQRDNLADMRRKGRANDRRGPRGHRLTCSQGHQKGPGHCPICIRVAQARARERYRSEVKPIFDAAVRTYVLPAVPQDFRELVMVLGARRADIFARYFALYGYSHQTLTEIGSEYRVSRERVRQIRETALGELGISESVLEHMPSMSLDGAVA